MSYGIAVYNEGVEALTKVSPLNLVDSLRLENLAAGTHQIPVEIGTEGQLVVGTCRLHSIQRTVSLGGSATTRVTVSSSYISGGNLVVVLTASAVGATELFFTVWRARA